jgi:hypothetical protein
MAPAATVLQVHVGYQRSHPIELTEMALAQDIGKKTDAAW